MSITKERLNVAGWLSITNAVVTIPLVVISVFLVAIGGAGGKIIQAALTLASLGLFVYIFWSLRNLLNSRFQFHDVDTYISALIWGNVVISILSVLSLVGGGLEIAVNLLSIVALIPFGIVLIVFAIRILRLSDDLSGFLKPFSYTSIATGVCFATIILIPLGLIASAASDVILGMIFFRAAERSTV